MADVVLQYNVAPADYVELTGAVRSGDGRETLLPSTPQLCSLGALHQLSAEIVTTLSDAMAVLAGEDEGSDLRGAEAHVRELQKLGTQLRQMVLPDQVVQWLQRDRSVRHIVFRHNPLLNGVPFDAVYLDSDFLCFQYAVAKQLLNSAARFEGPKHLEQRDAAFSVFSLINPDGSLPESVGDAFNAFRNGWMEDETLAGLFDFTDARISRGIEREETLTKFHNADVVLLNCHHLYEKESPEDSGFVLGQIEDGSRKVLTARNLMDRFGSAVRPPRFVLSLSCDSGITTGWEAQWPNTPAVYGMVDALQRIGVPHYVGSICAIPAVHAPKIVPPFFRSLAEGRSIGEAMRQARRNLRPDPNDVSSGGTVLGLSLVLYGDPAKACFCAQHHRVDASATVECTAIDQDSGRECGKTVCPRDAGYGQRRCSVHRQDHTIRCSAGHKVSSIDDLHLCKADGCSNTFCSQCPGSAHSLCWYHACHSSGLPVVSEHARKTCRGHAHDDENRTICPADDGWMQGLCVDCLEQPGEEVPDTDVSTCSHDGLFVDAGNPWKGVCHVCGKRTCTSCEPWHEKTLCCSDPLQADREGNWRAVLQKHGGNDPDVMSHQKLCSYSAMARSLQDGLSSNLNAYATTFAKIPRLGESLLDVFLPQARTMRLQANIHTTQGAWLPLRRAGVAGSWNWPPTRPGGEGVWQPPEDWKNLLEHLNQLQVTRLQAAWGAPVLVAVATIAPLRFEARRGPVGVPASAGHLQSVWEVLEEWWSDAHRRQPMPDTYMAAFSATGWADDLKPGLSPHRAEFLFAPAANTFSVRRPPLAGMPASVRRFGSHLRPQTIHERMQHIEEWIEEYLDAWDSVTWDVAQREIAATHEFLPTSDEVVATFDELSATGPYRKYKVNSKPALRPATIREQGRALLRRRWVEIASTCAGVALSMGIWQVRHVMLLHLPSHWGIFLGTTLVTVLLCNGIGQTIKYLSTAKAA